MAYDPVLLKMMWDRLIAVVDEADTALGRMAFSTVVREAHDYVTVLLDAEGRSIAQCTYSIPSFIGTLPITARHIMERIPASRESLNNPDFCTSSVVTVQMMKSR